MVVDSTIRRRVMSNVLNLMNKLDLNHVRTAMNSIFFNRTKNSFKFSHFFRNEKARYEVRILFAQVCLNRSQI